MSDFKATFFAQNLADIISFMKSFFCSLEHNLEFIKCAGLIFFLDLKMARNFSGGRYGIRTSAAERQRFEGCQGRW